MFPFRSLPPSFRFASSFPCVTSVLSFHVLYSVRYFSPFVSTLRVVSTLRFRSLRLSFRFTFPLLCVTSVRSFQVLYPVRFFFPFVSTLPCRLLRPSFWFNSSRVVSTFPFRSLRPFFHFKSPLPFKYFLSFVLTLMSCSFRFSFRSTLPFYSLRLRLRPSFVSILLFHLLLPFFRINSFVLIVQFFLPFQLFLSIRCVCAFVSTLLSCSFSSSFPFNSSISLRPSIRFNSSLLLDISFLSFQLSPHVSQKTWKNCFSGVAIRAGICRPSNHLRPLAATCHSGHLRPLAATRVAASGCKWLQVAACKWLQVAANNANGCKWRCSGNFKSYQ